MLMSRPPVSGHAHLASLTPVALSSLRKDLGGGVGGHSGPQTEDALPLLDLLPTEEPEKRGDRTRVWEKIQTEEN